MNAGGPNAPQKSEAPETRVGVIGFKSLNFVSLTSNYSKTETVLVWHPRALYDVLRLGFIINDVSKEGRGKHQSR